MAGGTVEKYAELNVIKDWAEIGKREAHEGTELEDLIHLLSGFMIEEKGLEFTMKREKDTATF